MAAGSNAEALAVVSEWRRMDMRVVVSLDESRGEELWRAAQQSEILFAAVWTGQGFDLYGWNPDQPASATYIPLAEAGRIVQQARARPHPIHV